MKRTKFYVCPHCGSFMQGTGNGQVVCCGKLTKSSQSFGKYLRWNIRVSQLTLAPVASRCRDTGLRGIHFVHSKLTPLY